MKRFFIFLLVYPGLFLQAQQDLRRNFSPLKSKGTLPDVFTENIRNIISNDINDLNKSKEKDKSLKQTYLTEANYQIENIIKSGNALINDEITAYLNKIADVLLKNDAALRSSLHIYTLKSPVVNAYSYDKGYIFIDIGLIAQVETEAQLAYILSHEISHYIKRHNINEYVKNQKLDRENYDGSEEKLLKKCQYSKDQESEADVEGFRLYGQTDYSLQQASKAFDVLQYSHLPFELMPFDKKFLETEKFAIPSRYFLKEVSSIRNNSGEDDSKHTHPNTATRKKSIAALIPEKGSGTSISIIGQAQFEYIRDVARMELCRIYLVNRDYPNALYAAYMLLSKYPDNEFLREVVSKTLYALTLYKKGMLSYTSDSYLDGGIPAYGDIESYPQQVYYFINTMPENEWTFMSLNYAFRAHKKFSANKEIEMCSDSLFKLVKGTKWGIVDFVRTNKKDTLKQVVADPKSKTDVIANIQIENNFKGYDTAYYKEAFLDLFQTDKEFLMKFPQKGSDDDNSGFTGYGSGIQFRSYTRSKKGVYLKYNGKVEKVLLLEPFYLKIDATKRKEEVQYVLSDQKQERFSKMIAECAQQQNFGLVVLDPGMINSGDVDKLNDYSVINDWFTERYDGNMNERNPILGTDEINKIIEKYGTQYILRTGILNYRISLRKKRTYFYSYIFDLKTNSMVYKKYETFRDKDAADLLYAKLYQTFYELKHAK